MEIKSEFLTDLLVKELPEEGKWELRVSLIYRSRIYGGDIEVPYGFITDFASVPRVPVVYDFYGDRAHHESVIHDWLYKIDKISRLKADRIFLEAMKVRGKPLWIRWPMFLGVRMGGWKPWKEYRSKDDGHK